jgi:predicted metalloendopeptidase
MRSFTTVSLHSRRILKSIAENASSTGDKIGILYHSCMNEEELEDVGMKPLWHQLEGISEATNIDELFNQVGKMELKYVASVFQSSPFLS